MNWCFCFPSVVLIFLTQAILTIAFDYLNDSVRGLHVANVAQLGNVCVHLLV